MYTRKLIDFLFPGKQQTESLPNVGASLDAEFDWPPSAADMEALSVVRLRTDDGPEIAPVSGVADVA